MPTILTVAIQSAFLKTAANLTAQLVAIRSTHLQDAIDWQRVFEFALYGFIQGHINFWWQNFLEHMFPSNRSRGSGVSYHGLVCKILVDQTIGIVMMNTTFLTCTNILRLRDMRVLLPLLRDRIPRIVKAAWKIWPAVAALNFFFVPLQYRAMVAATVGFGWNMFLTFFLHQ